MESREPIVILIAEDDPDDRMLTIRALQQNRLANDIKWVEDGEELMDYLHRRGAYADEGSAPRPGLILLDLNTSHAERDIVQSYDLGVNAFVTKPVTFVELAKAIRVLGNFWFQIVKLPPRPGGG